MLTLTSSSTLRRPHCLRSQTSSGYIAIRMERHQGHNARMLVAHFDELIYSAQATLPQESDQLRLHRHSATSPFGWNATKAATPGAQLLTLTSSSTLHRSRCLRSQTSLGYIAIRLERHQGHSARSPVAHFDELIYSTQATLPQESDQLRLHRHSAGTPPRPQRQEPVAHADELFPSVHGEELMLKTPKPLLP